MKFAFPPPAPTVLGIHGSDEMFPVRRVYCVGLNYAEHVLEMGFERQPPLFFAKPADAVVYVPEGSTGSVPYPTQTQDETLAQLSRYFTLEPGDLIFSGTPEGVGPVLRGDLMVGGVAGLGELRVQVR